MRGPQQHYSAETHCGTRLGRSSLVNSSSQELAFWDQTDWETFRPVYRVLGSLVVGLLRLQKLRFSGKERAPRAFLGFHGRETLFKQSPPGKLQKSLIGMMLGGIAARDVPWQKYEINSLQRGS